MRLGSSVECKYGRLASLNAYLVANPTVPYVLGVYMLHQNTSDHFALLVLVRLLILHSSMTQPQLLKSNIEILPRPGTRYGIVSHPRSTLQEKAPKRRRLLIRRSLFKLCTDEKKHTLDRALVLAQFPDIKTTYLPLLYSRTMANGNEKQRHNGLERLGLW